MTAPYGRPDALIQTDQGPARVYSARGSGTLDAAIVTDDYELLIPESEVEHLCKAIAPDLDYVDPNVPTAGDIRDQAGDMARTLRKCIAAYQRIIGTPDDWTTPKLPALFEHLDNLLAELYDIAADLDSLIG